MARDRWQTIMQGDKVKLTPRPTAPPSAPIIGTYIHAKLWNGFVAAYVIEPDHKGLQTAYPVNQWTITKED
ncbi:MAG: hypothetical protein WC479_10845 [Candidatus Izemoplasmatales bacterium]